MILADTSVWIAHFQSPSETFSQLLDAGTIHCHPYVIGELAMGSLGRRRETVMEELGKLDTLTFAQPREVVGFVEDNALHSRGIGFVDASLLASVLITPGATLLTRDRRLRRIAEGFNVSANLSA